MRSLGVSWIYVLRDPRTLEVRYVGKTVNLEARFRVYENLGSHSKHLREWFLELQQANLKPLAVPVWVVAQGDDLNAAEAAWYAHFRKKGSRLLNRSGFLREGRL